MRPMTSQRHCHRGCIWFLRAARSTIVAQGKRIGKNDLFGDALYSCLVPDRCFELALPGHKILHVGTADELTQDRILWNEIDRAWLEPAQ